MRRSSRVLAALLTASLAAAPVFVPFDAWARAGSGSSMGSRGGRTYSAPPTTNTAPYTAAPMQRSVTPQSPSYGSGYASPGYGQAGPGLSRGGAFTSGLLGGLVGAGIGGMLFGHGLTGGLNGGLSFIGLLLQLALLFFIGRWLFRRFLGGGRPAMAGLGSVGGMMRQGQQPGYGQPLRGDASMGGGGIGGGMGAQPNVAVTSADFQQFERSLQAVQAAWSARDMNGIRELTTPEMAGYFNEQLAQQANQGVRNTVTDVRLEKGDLSEAWNEDSRDYATVAMRFSMIDVTRDMRGMVVDGDPNQRAQAVELWTFMRPRGGRWMLSAIQQAR